MKNDDKDIIKEIIATGSEISGGVGGAIIGNIVAGPVGAIWGGASGPVLTRLFKSIGTEIKGRFLSRREEVRIGAAYTFALNKIHRNQELGLELRKDDFFGNAENDRPPSVEILEGIILSSQREFEELKLKYLGNLYANICYDSGISREHANQLIKTADSLTFRQFCILQLLNERYIASEQLNFKIRALDKWQLDQMDIIAEVRELNQIGLVYIPLTYDGGDNSSPIQLSKLNITKNGRFFCKVLSLDEIESEILDKLNAQTSIKE